MTTTKISITPQMRRWNEAVEAADNALGGDRDDAEPKLLTMLIAHHRLDLAIALRIASLDLEIHYVTIQKSVSDLRAASPNPQELRRLGWPEELVVLMYGAPPT